MNRLGKRISKKILLYVVLIVGALVAFFPFYWMVSSALKPSNEIIQYPPEIIPNSITFEHFQYVFQTMNVPRAFMNSMIVSVTTVVLNALLSGMVAYALVKLRFPGKKLLFGIVMAFMMVPFQLLIVPLFMTMTTLNLIGTYSGELILHFSASSKYAHASQRLH